MDLARGLGSNEKVEMTQSAKLGEDRTWLICVFLPWLCCCSCQMRQLPFRDATWSVVVHFAARAMLSSQAPRRFRARIVREARAYGMKCAYGCMNDI